MNFDEYQSRAESTAIYPEDSKVTYPVLGLIGEVGEFANKHKKTIRDGREFSIGDQIGELGDILWYLSAICSDLGISLSSVAERNVAKLEDRQDRGVLGGSGDSR